ncbi:MAG: hypothetical protein PVI25_08385 [Gammaproteobacteria bacterium]
MVIRRIRLVITVLMTTLAAAFLFTSTAMAGNGPGSHKFEGAWIAKAPEVGGQWTYVLSPNSSGHRASGHGSIEAGFNVEALFGPSDDTSPLLIQLEMTGRDTAVANSIWYGRRELPSTSPVSHELVFIGTAYSTIEFTGPDKLTAVHDFAFYSPDKDADGDGLPDTDAEPDLELQLTSYDTRLPSP